MMNIKIQNGRNFMDSRDAPTTLLTGRLAEVMGLSPENAVGNELECGMEKGNNRHDDDFHNDNLKFGIEPMIFMYSEKCGLPLFH